MVTAAMVSAASDGVVRFLLRRVRMLLGVQSGRMWWRRWARVVASFWLSSCMGFSLVKFSSQALCGGVAGVGRFWGVLFKNAPALLT